MAGQSHQKNLQYPLQPPSSSSTSSSMKMIKTVIQTLFYAQFLRVVRALAKAKSILLHALKEINLNQPLRFIYQAKATKKQNKIIFGSFRLHYNWCSSHVVPIPAQSYYDSTWNSVISTEPCVDNGSEETESQLSGYLQWLEDRKGNAISGEAETADDIDRLAEMFIASCHEKFLLEKQESYRRFQEMLARSM